ncbi:hypothetical protein [Desulfosarcina cetonica]|uniref:hypothetical protein n=1 Tax=Desulfosarcina cetonica TaxID=90730 RepID=UPI0012ED9FCE|nr:hypothetical protein [Desulfosarcina cetonica]
MTTKPSWPHTWPPSTSAGTAPSSIPTATAFLNWIRKNAQALLLKDKLIEDVIIA